MDSIRYTVYLADRKPAKMTEIEKRKIQVLPNRNRIEFSGTYNFSEIFVIFDIFEPSTPTLNPFKSNT